MFTKDYERERQLKGFDNYLNELQEELLNEELCKASLTELNNQMKTNKELKKLLTTKAADLPEKYKFLVDEVFAEPDNVSLYDLIKQSQSKLGSDKVFFSKVEKKLLDGQDMTLTDQIKKLQK